jgi:hypothetical protein
MARGFMHMIKVLAIAVMLLGNAIGALWAKDKPAFQGPSLGVGPQYGGAHVYLAPEDLDRFSASVIATFGGTRSQPSLTKITPTSSETELQFVFTPAGSFSVFGFKTPIPYPFGIERNGYLVADFDAAVRSAKAHNADIVVAPFPDPIGRDVIIAWPGGVHMQLYWHTTPPNYAKLQTVPENRVYVSAQRADQFVGDFVEFSHGKIVSDNKQAPGVEIGRPNDTYRRVRIDSAFGKITVLVTEGHLPYPYAREIMGYEVASLSDTLAKAKDAGVTVLVDAYTADSRDAAMVAFPGGYIAEIHSSLSN